MPLPLVAAFWAALIAIIVPLATRLLIGLGFGVVTYLGASAILDSATAGINSYLGGTSASILVILQMARIDDAIAVVLSGLAAKAALMGYASATGVKQFRFKGAGF